MPHAYLFVGPEGVGKKTVALALAQAIQCQEIANDFCGRCADCIRVTHRNHPDFHELEPGPGKKEISIQQVRDLERELSLRPFCGRRKIAVVDPACLMNTAAQNALLKTLEEPPQGSLIILISTSTGGLLPTLVSRCVRLFFTPVPVDVVVELLVARKGAQREQARLLANLAMGSPGRALSGELDLLVERRRVWLEKIAAVGAGDYRAALAAAEELGAAKEETLRFLEWAEGWYRDIMVYAVRKDDNQLLNRDCEEVIRQQADRYSLERLLVLRSRAARTAARIQRNVNRRLALENFFLQTLRAS
ncbi:MAG: DNA polymerase III subunit delta' [Deltaproteobacteria bacterium]|nr:DNA polymerase III subunit delta' [Deltaproteobacteria bacterium]